MSRRPLRTAVALAGILAAALPNALRAQRAGAPGAVTLGAVTLGAPTPDSLASLVLARFATGTPAAFDSVYPDPLGRAVVASAVQRKESRGAGIARVIRSDPRHAVLLITGVVHAGTGTGIHTGGDETNLVRRFSGLYQATRSGDAWTLTRQIPLDTGNFIQRQTLHVTLTPGTASHILDTLSVAVGGPYGLATRLNTAARITTLQLDGRTAPYVFGGGVLWIDAPPRARSTLVLDYTIPDEHRAPARTPAADTLGAVPVHGALHNTDAWHPFFNYDSGHDFAPLSVTVELPARYLLTTTVPQTGTVHDSVRVVHGESMHPEFLLSLIYDRAWTPVTTSIRDLRFETFTAPDFPFSHDTLAGRVDREYRVLVPRFGEPQLPSHYLAVVEDRDLGHGGFSVRMNNAVISGDHPILLDDPYFGPSSAFAHEVAHGWTMDASGPAANFLQEGWATYAESLILRTMYGPATEHAFWESKRTGYVAGLDRAGFLGGFEGKQSILGNPDNGRIHYFKGSWILHSLDDALGDSVFDRGMRAFITHAGQGPNGYQEFIADMSRAAGHDMASFIMPWLSETYIPDVQGRVEGRRLIVTQTQPTAPFDLPLDVALVTPSGTVHRAVHLTTPADTTDVGDVGAVSQVHVDPDHHFLLRRHWGDTARFVLRAPAAKTVELSGNFLAKPVRATRTGDLWTVQLPLTEGRYSWIWRVDGKTPPDADILAAARAGATGPDAVAGVRIVPPTRLLPDADAR